MGKFRNKFVLEDLENLSEEVVFEELYNGIEDKSYDVCQCDVCIQDVAALLLNRVQSVYCCSVFEKSEPRETLQEVLGEVRKSVKKELPDVLDLVRAKAHH